MAKIIRVIDLLNKIANGEIPSKIKYRNRIYEFDSNEKDYMYEDIFNRYDYLIGNNFQDLDNLNDTVEILEEQQDIDIQRIEELDINDGLANFEIIDKFNELVQAVKQNNREINKLKEK